MANDSVASAPTLIQSLQRGMLLVEAVMERGPSTARTLSDATGIALPTTYHLLRTLQHENYLRRTADGLYELGGQMASVTQFGCRARRLRVIRQAMTDLAAEARASVVTGVLRGTEIVVSRFLAHPSSPRFECWPGMELPGHATAVGKNILFQMDPRQRSDYLTKHPLTAITAQTVTTAWRLDNELAEARLAHSDQQYLYGISCAATALTDSAGLAAIGVAFPSARTARLRDRTDLVLTAAADRISAVLDECLCPMPVAI